MSRASRVQKVNYEIGDGMGPPAAPRKLDEILKERLEQSVAINHLDGVNAPLGRVRLLVRRRASRTGFLPFIDVWPAAQARTAAIFCTEE